MNDTSPNDDDGTARLVLSIDGGGFRGLCCLFVLEHLMEEVKNVCDEVEQPKPYQIFDLICGTSTGGLIAILLGRFGLSCKEAIKVYQEIGRTMFNGEADNGKIWGNIVHGGQFSSSKLEKKLADIIKVQTKSKDTPFKTPEDAPDYTRTFVTVVSKIGSAGIDAYRIRSYLRPAGTIDPSPYGHDWTIFEGARATCAAPLYLSPLKIQNGYSTYLFQDAGPSGFNNPAKVAVSEAEKLFGDGATITLVSLGTGLRNLVEGGKDLQDAKQVTDEQVDSFTVQILESVKQARKNIKNASDLAKRIAKQLLEVATDTEISHNQIYEQFKRNGTEARYFRFNNDQGLGSVNLTDCRQEAAIHEMTAAWITRSQEDISRAVRAMQKQRRDFRGLKTEIQKWHD